MNKTNEIAELIEGKTALEILQLLTSLTNERIVFSTSLGYEDQVITHFIFSEKLGVKFPIVKTNYINEMVTKALKFWINNNNF